MHFHTYEIGTVVVPPLGKPRHADFGFVFVKFDGDSSYDEYNGCFLYPITDDLLLNW